MSAPSDTDELTAATATSDTRLRPLDPATVGKMTHATPRDSALAKLLVPFRTRAVGPAGDARGLRIRPSRGEHHTAAEAVAGAGDVTVRLRRAATDGSPLPESVFDHVARTRERVILDDASRSVLCLPLVKQGA